jgi:hypothetical protein
MKSIVRKSIPTDSYNPLHPTAPAGMGLQVQESEFEQALVVDVITNDEHPLFSKGDGYNVGMVQFKFRSDDFTPNNSLLWANPLFSNFSEYPLRGELVYIFQSMKRWWYMTRFNVSNRVTTQDLPSLLDEMVTPPTSDDISKTYTRKTTTTTIGSDTTNNTVGVYFKDLPDVYRLRHIEGDMILEGRSGASIRFGTSWLNQKPPFKSLYGDQAPNIMLRVGADPTAKKTVDTTFGQVVEDINKDKSSIWMVTDQVVNLRYATEGSIVHAQSVNDLPQLIGNQIVVNTDQLVMNTKTGRIISSAARGIHSMTLMNHTVDVGQDYISHINRDSGITVGHDRLTRVIHDDSLIVEQNQHISVLKSTTMSVGETMYIGVQKDVAIFAGGTVAIKGSKVIVGDSQSTEEPMVCGNSLAAFLGALIDALAGNPTPSPTAIPGINTFTHILVTGAPGSPSVLNPTIAANLMKLKADVLNGGGQYASFNSRLGFVKKLP